MQRQVFTELPSNPKHHLEQKKDSKMNGFAELTRFAEFLDESFLPGDLEGANPTRNCDELGLRELSS